MSGASRQGESVADAVGRALAAAGAEVVFGVLGSGNLVVTNALVAGGARFVAARHEAGAVCMADGWARVSGGVGVASVHQGPGLTNAITGIAEAVKSHTPLLVLAADTPAAAIHSNFRIDQHGLVESVGAAAERIHSPASAVEDALRAWRRAELERRPLVLMLPLDVQASQAPAQSAGLVSSDDTKPVVVPAPAASAVAQAAGQLAAARRPVIVAGRGAVLADARAALEALAARCGALLATSAPANGLFDGAAFALGIAGGFATPLALELLPQADLVLAFGATLNQWTTRHGTLFGDAQVIQIDVDPTVLGAHGPRAATIVGDAAATAEAILNALPPGDAPGWRSPDLAAEIVTRRWSDEPLEAAAAPRADGGPKDHHRSAAADLRASLPPGTERTTVDPRALTIALDRILPADRLVAVDSGHFLGWPAMYLPVRDARAWVFPNGFQAVGLGLGNAIGAAVAEPERITVAALGDGGAFMALPELETAVRLGLELLVLIYDDAAYGAEVHHFAPAGHDVTGARFPDADLAALGRAAGAEAVTVRSTDDLQAVETWVAAGAGGPLVVDAKVDPSICAAWLEDAFRGG
ncbi:thiamine pyrophosphate-binding protein [Conexibacter sp. CPCC 206217]|uniref:thiamine pyrophosphate-binding protein n=1 Tax=Conexibacter sp. CPCC 206217 TaxID=3064574 RepID=UPI002719434F|nr:thiamine pyrophosphate-binding protein [Conexibacter sp. CPCC 206217]MDO8213344.1 thiamine pyrophosphate-binding protein [Conexibacter sp. CPCC 206217]